MHNEFIINNYRVLSFLDLDVTSSLIEQYTSNSLSFVHTFKDKKRCLVARFKTDSVEGDFTIKVPRSRNRGVWERILTLFRPGESIRQFHNLQELQKIGFIGPSPILATEKRRFGVVVDGFIIYRFIEGRRGTSADVHRIAPELLKLYRLGYTRNDPKPNNFLISPEAVYFIDFKINKPFFLNKTRCLIESCKFTDKVPAGNEYLKDLPSSDLQLKLASVLQKTFKVLRRFRRIITGSHFRNEE